MMEKKYQHMMEQVNMDEGFASGLLERIREIRASERRAYQKKATYSTICKKKRPIILIIFRAFPSVLK